MGHAVLWICSPGRKDFVLQNICRNANISWARERSIALLAFPLHFAVDHSFPLNVGWQYSELHHYRS